MTPTPTDEQIDTAIRTWGQADDRWVAVAEIIIGTNLRERVVPKYLVWSEDLATARPDLRKVLYDEENGNTPAMASSTYFLATLASNIKGGGTQPVDLQKLWSLGEVQRATVVRALQHALHV